MYVKFTTTTKNNKTKTYKSHNFFGNYNFKIIHPKSKSKEDIQKSVFIPSFMCVNEGHKYGYKLKELEKPHTGDTESSDMSG